MDSPIEPARSYLSLADEEVATKLTKDNLVTLELWSIPADPDSAKVKCNVRIVSGTETPREILHWTNDLTNQVFPGLGLDQPTSGPGKKALLQTLTTGNAFQVVKVTTEYQAQLVRAHRANAAHADPNKRG